MVARVAELLTALEIDWDSSREELVGGKAAIPSSTTNERPIKNAEEDSMFAAQSEMGEATYYRYRDLPCPLVYSPGQLHQLVGHLEPTNTPRVANRRYGLSSVNYLGE